MTRRAVTRRAGRAREPAAGRVSSVSGRELRRRRGRVARGRMGRGAGAADFGYERTSQGTTNR